MLWRTSRREFSFERTLVMGILNVTPDSFSDGGRFGDTDSALRRAGQMIAEGADIIDIGGESTRPASARVSVAEEIRRVVPVVEAVTKRFETAVSIDTSKSEVARVAVEAGAEIINDVSGFRFDKEIARVAADSEAALVLMHLRGSFKTMHSEPPAADIFADVTGGWHESLLVAEQYGIERNRIALDLGIGFSKSPEQNLELLAKLGKLVREFETFPILAGTSRKSFIGRISRAEKPADRLAGSLASASVAVWNGARIVRVHDVAETVQAIRVVEAIKGQL